MPSNNNGSAGGGDDGSFGGISRYPSYPNYGIHPIFLDTPEIQLYAKLLTLSADIYKEVVIKADKFELLVRHLDCQGDLRKGIMLPHGVLVRSEKYNVSLDAFLEDVPKKDRP